MSSRSDAERSASCRGVLWPLVFLKSNEFWRAQTMLFDWRLTSNEEEIP